MCGRVRHSIGYIDGPRPSRTELVGCQRENRYQWAASPFVVRNIHSRRVAGRNDEGVIDFDFIGTEIHRSMNMELGLFESLSRRKGLHLAATILDSERTAFDDVVRAARMIMPLKGFPGRNQKLPHRDRGRPIKEF